MISGTSNGHIVLWDLEGRKMHSQIRQAHRFAVANVACLNNEPVIVSNSADNSIKMWIMDMPDGSGRLLRHVDGHSAPPMKVRFYAETAENIVSAGKFL